MRMRPIVWLALCTTLGCQQILGIEVGEGTVATGGASSTGGSGGTGGEGGDGSGGDGGGGGSGACGGLPPGSVLSVHADYGGALGDGDVHDVAIAADGRVVLTGTFNRTIRFGTMELQNSGVTVTFHDAFVVTYDPVGGGYSNLVQLGGDGDVEPRSLAVAPDGTVFVVGSFRGQLTLPGGHMADAPTGTTGGFVVKVSPAGMASIAHSFLMDMIGAQAVVTGAAWDEGGLWIAGHFNGTMTIDGRTPSLSSTNHDVFIGHRLPASASLSIEHIAAPGNDRAAGIAALGDGTALVAGTHDDTFEGFASKGADDVWFGLALPESPPRLDVQGSFGGPEGDGLGGVGAHAGQGALVLHHGSAFGLGTDVYGEPGFAVVSLQGAGPATSWVRDTLVDEGEVLSTGVVRAADGAIIATGYLKTMSAAIDFAGNMMSLTGKGADEAGLLVSYGPDGEHRYSALVAASGATDAGNSIVHGVDTDGCRTWFSGRFGRGARSIERHDGTVTTALQDLANADALLFETTE